MPHGRSNTSPRSTHAPISKKRLAEIAAIADDDIDATEIPEADEAWFKGARLLLPTARSRTNVTERDKPPQQDRPPPAPGSERLSDDPLAATHQDVLDAPAHQVTDSMRKTLEDWYGHTTDLGFERSRTAAAEGTRGPWGPGGKGADLDAVEKEGWT